MKKLLIISTLFVSSICAMDCCGSQEKEFKLRDEVVEQYVFFPIDNDSSHRFQEDICEIFWQEELEHITPPLKTPSPSPENK